MNKYQIDGFTIEFDDTGKTKIQNEKGEILQLSDKMRGAAPGKLLKCVFEKKSVSYDELLLAVYGTLTPTYGSKIDFDPFGAFRENAKVWNDFFKNHIGKNVLAVDIKEDTQRITSTHPRKEHKVNITLCCEITEIFDFDADYNEYFRKLFKKLTKYNDRAAKTWVKDKSFAEKFVFPVFYEEENVIEYPIIKNWESHRIFLRGCAGIGKSMFFQAVCLSIAAKHINDYSIIPPEEKQFYDNLYKNIYGDSYDSELFPVLIEGKDYKPEKGLFGNAICSDSSSFIKLCEKSNQNQKLLFLIDGVDEVAPENQEAFKQEISKIVEENSKVLISGRYIDYLRTLLSSYDKFFLKGFSEENITDYINRCSTLTSEEQERIKSFTLKPDVKEMASNPFVLIDIINQKDNLNIYNVVQKYVNETMDRIKKSDDSIKKYLTENKTTILNNIYNIAFSLAKDSHNEEKSISLNLFKELFFEDIKANEDIFKKMLDFAGICDLCEDSSGEVYIKFQNDLLLCYFASQYLTIFFIKTEKELGAVDTFVVLNAIDKQLLNGCGVNGYVSKAFAMFMSYIKSNKKLCRYLTDYLIIKILNTENFGEKQHILDTFVDIINNKYGDSYLRFNTNPPDEKFILEFLIKHFNEG